MFRQPKRELTIKSHLWYLIKDKTPLRESSEANKEEEK